MTYGARGRGKLTVNQLKSDSARMSSIWPMPSTWPCTKCPPRRLSARSGRSRLTAAPCCSEPSVVTRTVSGPTSAWTSPRSERMTVRQTPFTARLSPDDNSPASDVAIRSRTPPAVGLRSTSSPTASTRPVNISFNQRIGTEPQFAAIDELRRIECASAEKRHAARADDARADVNADQVHEVFIPRRRVHFGSALDEQRFDAEIGEALERRPQRRPLDGFDSGAARFERLYQLGAGRGRRRSHDHDRPGGQCREDGRVRRSAQPSIEYDPRQRAFAIYTARREQRIVDENRLRTDGNRVYFRAKQVGVPVGFGRRQDRPLARRLGDVAILAHRCLEHDERPVLAHEGEIGLVQATRLRRRDADVDGDIVRAQMLETFTAHERIRILDGGDHARDARRDDAFHTRTGSAAMTARLERAVQRGAPRVLARFVERHDFGVRLANATMIALADDDAVIRHDDRADERIRTRLPAAALGQLQRAIHVIAVGHLFRRLPFLFEKPFDVLLRRKRHEVVDRLA